MAPAVNNSKDKRETHVLYHAAMGFEELLSRLHARTCVYRNRICREATGVDPGGCGPGSALVAECKPRAGVTNVTTFILLVFVCLVLSNTLSPARQKPLHLI
jgi:hypothetical protein